MLVEPDGAATLFADFRYAARGRAGRGRRVRGGARGTCSRAIGERLAGRRVGFEEAHLPYAATARSPRRASTRCPTSGLVEGLRAVKDEDEIAIVRRAGALSDDVFEALSEERFSGRTERELAWWIERSFREAGAEGVSFPAIVAARRDGDVAARRPGDRAIEEGVLVIVDAGCVVDGYCSDCTRTFAVGEISERLREIYALCLEAQLAGLAAVGPGCAAVEAVDAAARDVIEAQGLGDAFGHGLGHGVGIQIHEAPSLRPESEDVLEPGNVVIGRAGDLPAGRGRRPDRGSRARDGGRRRAADAVHEGARHRRLRARQASPLQCRARWPRPSTRTSSGTGCTSSSTAASGASSSSST